MDKAAIDIAKGARAALGVDHLRAARGVAAASSHAAADAALPRPLDPRDHLQASGAGLWRPLHGHRTEAGAGRRRFAEPRLGYTRAADLLEAGHAARAGVARGHPYGPHPCRRHRVARPALPFPRPGRAKDHWRPLVGPAVLRPQAAAAGLSFNRENTPWPGLIPREPGSPSAARSTPANRPTRASIRNSILSMPSGRLAR